MKTLTAMSRVNSRSVFVYELIGMVFTRILDWRRERDLNPRGPERSTGSQGLRINHSAIPALLSQIDLWLLKSFVMRS